MPENRNNLIDKFVGNLSNAIVHEALFGSAENKEAASYYKKELDNSMRISRAYREKINPVDRTFSKEDIEYIRKRVINKSKAKLMTRILQDYPNIDLSLVESLIDRALKELGIA